MSVCAASAGVASFSCPQGYKVSVAEAVSADVPGDVFCEGRQALSLCREIGGLSVCAVSAGVASFSCPQGYKVSVAEAVSADVPGDVSCKGRQYTN